MTEQQINSTTAFGRRLSDLWLDGEEGKLHPAEWKLLDCAARGEVCDLGTERPAVATNKNRIRANLLRFIGIGGDEAHPLHQRGIRLDGAFIECENSGLDLSGTVVPANFGLFNCCVDGSVDFTRTKLQALQLDGSEIETFFGDGLNSTGSIHLRDGFRVNGIVCFPGAKVDGNLVCRGGIFSDSEKAINLQGATVSGALIFDQGFLAKGTIDLTSATIGTELLLSDAIFSCKDKSIHAPRAKIGGNVELGKECCVAGQVSFQGASIGGDLTFAGGSFEGKPAINLRNAQIDGTLVWRGVEHARGELNLSGASCLTLNMDRNSWEKPSQIRLDNFTFKGFTELPEGCNAQFWRDWLERQPEKYLTTRFRPNPYNQLADVLDRMGHEQEAKSIRVEQRRRQSEFTRLYEPLPDHDSGRLTRKAIVFWNSVQGALVDYGYRPGKAVAYLLGFVAIGSVVFYGAARDGIIAPTHPLIFKEIGKSIPKACADNWVYFPKASKADCEAAIPSEYSEFNSIMYSIDLALPIVNFRMENDWAPRVVNQQGKRYWPGWWVRTWEWVQIAAGWMLSLLFVSAIGGIIRR